VNNPAIYHKHVFLRRTSLPARCQRSGQAAKQQTAPIDHDNVRILQIKLLNSSWKLHI